ncbi:MAG: hypothetical protein E5Y60_34605 [Mesorhizobium sp.]|nr:MAG: hypothetical protein E5Y60_34605 [Mesorhizobium sp.]
MSIEDLEGVRGIRLETTLFVACHSRFDTLLDTQKITALDRDLEQPEIFMIAGAPYEARSGCGLTCVDEQVNETG